MSMQEIETSVSARPIAVGFGRGAEISGLSKSTLRKLYRDGKLKTTRVGRRRLVLFSSLNDLLQNGARMQ